VDKALGAEININFQAFGQLAGNPRKGRLTANGDERWQIRLRMIV